MQPRLTWGGAGARWYKKRRKCSSTPYRVQQNPNKWIKHCEADGMVEVHPVSAPFAPSGRRPNIHTHIMLAFPMLLRFAVYCIRRRESRALLQRRVYVCFFSVMDDFLLLFGFSGNFASMLCCGRILQTWGKITAQLQSRWSDLFCLMRVLFSRGQSKKKARFLRTVEAD